MSTLTTENLMQMVALNDEIKEVLTDNPAIDPRIMIIKSNFVAQISQSFVQFKMLKKQNEFIFDENNSEILAILNKYEEIRQNKIP